jgi:hypothetical protein
MQPGVLGGADAVLTPCAAAVPKFQVRELPAPGIGGEALGEPVADDSVSRGWSAGWGHADNGW